MIDLNKYPAMRPNFSVKVAEEIAPNHAVINIEPLLQSYGHTVGNALRRVMLASLPGAAITTIKFVGADHQYTTLPGWNLNLLDVMLNLKQVALSSTVDDEGTLTLRAKGTKRVTAGDIECSAGYEVINKDQYIVDLADGAELEIEMKAGMGTGFLTLTDAQTSTVGEILVDAIFSPVLNVAYRVEATRVGRQTDFDRLILDITTNGSITPLEAVEQAAKILATQFTQVFDPINIPEETTDIIDNPQEAKAMLLTVEELDLPTRISNALRKGGFRTVHDLVSTPRNKVVAVKNLGEKSVVIIEEVLAARNIKFKED